MSDIKERLIFTIKDMLKTQALLNVKTNGERYISDRPTTDKGKFISYPICMKMEAAELLDSVPWKHWKYNENKYDIDNIRIEIIDILHFVLSIHIDHSARALLRDDEKLEDKTVLEHVDELIKFMESKNDNTNYMELLFDYLQPNVDYELRESKKMLESGEDAYVGFEHYIDLLLKFTFERNIMCIRQLYEVVFILYGLTCLVENKNANVDLQYILTDVYELYQAKLILNKFRQDHGYNEGTYKKMWKLDNGEEVEDNVFITRFIAQRPTLIGGYTLEQHLEKFYKKQFIEE